MSPAATPPLPRRAEELAEREASHLSPGERLCLQPDAMVPGNLLRPLIDGGEAFREMLAAVDAAVRTLDLEVYIWQADETGQRFADALAAKARAGVHVRAIVDGAGQFGSNHMLGRTLVSLGIDAVMFDPVGPWRQRWGWTVRDYRKLMVVDGHTAFLGGLNIANDYAAREDGGAGWHDIHARIEGPVVRMLQRLFDDAFHYASGRRLRGWARLRELRWLGRSIEAAETRDALEAPLTEPAPDARLLPLAIGRRRDRRVIQRHYQYAVAQAHKRVSIFAAYFIPNSSWRRTLMKAVQRGVEVRVLVPRVSDLTAVRYASCATYQPLLESGVRIFEYQPTMMHAKALSVDGEWCAIGSYNFDQRSLIFNWEIAVAALEPLACAQLESVFDADLQQSREISLATWRRRSWWQRVNEQFFHFFRWLL